MQEIICLKINDYDMKKTHILTGLAIVALAAVLLAKGPLTAGATTTASLWGSSSEDLGATLSLSTGLDNSLFMSNATSISGYYYAEVNAISQTKPSAERTPLNLSLVIDRSGSMAGDKLRYAKEAALYLVDQLQQEDYVSIVTYETGVEALVTSNRVGDKELLRKRIRAIMDGGSTNLHGGMLEGYAQVGATFKEGYVNRVLLLSDGLANVGISDTPSLVAIAKNKLNLNRISISTFGVGLDFNENLMTALAESGGGNYYFIHNPEEIPSIFKNELKGLGQVVARDAVLRIDLPEGLNVERVYGSTFEQNGRQLVVRMGEMVAGTKRAILVRFSSAMPMSLGSNWRRAEMDHITTSSYQPARHSLQSSGALSSSYAFHTELAYVDALAQPQRTVTTRSDDQLTATASAEEMVKSMSQRVKDQVVLYESNDRMEAAMKAVDAGQYDQARKLVQENDNFLNSNIDAVQRNAEIKTQMLNNTNYNNQIQHVETIKADDLKYIQKLNKSDNYILRNRK